MTDRTLRGYSAQHNHTVKIRGSAKNYDCVTCGKAAEEWSYDGLDPDEVTGTHVGSPVVYSLDPAHYVPRCKPCHRAIDRDRKRATQTRPDPRTTLTNETVIEIFTSTEPSVIISARLGIKDSTVRHIRRRASWVWLTRDLPDIKYDTVRAYRAKDL